MKIVHVVHRYFPNLGGVENLVRQIAEYQAKKNEVYIITGDYDESLKKEEIINNVKVIRLNSLKIKNKYFINFSVNKKLKELKPDILHIHSISNFISYSAMRYKGSKIVFTPYLHKRASSLLNDFLHYLYTPFKKYMFRKSAKIICLTNKEKEIIIKKYRVSSKKIDVLQPIVQISNDLVMKNNKLTKSSNPKKTKAAINILSVARLEKYKGVQHVITALNSIIFSENFKIQYTIIGTGPYFKKLKKIARKSQHKIIFKRYVHDLVAEIKKAHLLVNFSSSESFGIVTMQALLLSIPVIVKDPPFKVNSCFVAKNNKELKEKLKLFVNSETYRKFLRDQALPYASLQKKYSTENVCGRLFHIYQQVISKHQSVKKKKIMFLLRFTHPDKTFWCPQIFALTQALIKQYTVEWVIDSYTKTKKVNFQGINIHLNKISKNVMLRFFLELKNIIRKINLIKKFNPDIIFVRNDFIDGIIASFFCMTTHKKFVFNMSYPIYDSMLFEAKVFKQYNLAKLLYAYFGNLLLKIVIRKADVIVAISDLMKKKYFSDFSEKTLVFPMFAYYNNRKLSLPPLKKNNILYHGSLDRLRRIEFLIEVMSRLQDKEQNAKLIISGDGNARQQLKKLVKKRKMEDSIIFTGKIARNEIPRLFKQCKIALSPIPSNKIFNVSSPTKTYEYLAEGLPVVATKIPEHRKIAKHGAILLADYNLKDFTEKILSLLKDKTKLQRYSRKAIIYTQKKHDYKDICYTFIRALEEKV